MTFTIPTWIIVLPVVVALCAVTGIVVNRLLSRLLDRLFDSEGDR